MIAKSRLHMSYTHLTPEERYQIYALWSAGHSQALIARHLGRSPSTISREMGRNSGQRGYRPKQAHEQALERQQACPNARQITPEVWALVEGRLREDHSPEQIAQSFRAEGQAQVSHESIYRWVYAGKARGDNDLHTRLRCQKRRRKRYGSGRQWRGRIVNRRGIEERPLIVEARQRVGDWEADTVLGTQSALAMVTLNERVTRTALVARVEARTADEVAAAIIRLLRPLKALVHTLTFDNGKEFAHHEAIGKALSAECYFADPYSSWQRGANENMNGLLRQYFPKGRSLADVTDEDVDFAMRRLNTRPRKCLGWKAPHQMLASAPPEQKMTR